MLNDFFGKELKVGDKVVYIHKKAGLHTIRFRTGTVNEIRKGVVSINITPDDPVWTGEIEVVHKSRIIKLQ